MSKAQDKERPEFVGSFDAVAGWLGTSDRQWRTYSQRPGFPVKHPEGYKLAELERWKADNVAKKEPGALNDLKSELMQRQLELADLKIAREKKLSVSRAEVDAFHSLLSQRLRSFLYAKLEGEMPPKLAGCDALTIRQYGRALADEMVSTLSKDIDAWGEA